MNTLSLIKFQLKYCLKLLAIFMTILTIGISIPYFFKDTSPTVHIEGSSQLITVATLAIFLNFLIYNYKFLIQNSVTRKMIYKSSLVTMVILSLITKFFIAIHDIIFTNLSTNNITYRTLSLNIFRDYNVLSGTLLHIIFIFALLLISYFIALSYLRFGAKILLVPFILAIIFVSTFDYLKPLIFGILNIIKIAVGYNNDTFSLIHCIFSLIVFSLIVSLINYTTGRRLEIK